jgi:hypothetical protein
MERARVAGDRGRKKEPTTRVLTTLVVSFSRSAGNRDQHALEKKQEGRAPRHSATCQQAANIAL